MYHCEQYKNNRPTDHIQTDPLEGAKRAQCKLLHLCPAAVQLSHSLDTSAPLPCASLRLAPGIVQI